MKKISILDSSILRKIILPYAKRKHFIWLTIVTIVSFSAIVLCYTINTKLQMQITNCAKLRQDLDNAVDNLASQQALFKQELSLKFHRLYRLRHLLELADDALLVPYANPSPVIILERADKIVRLHNDPELLGLKDALSADIKMLQNISYPDINLIYRDLLKLKQFVRDLSSHPANNLASYVPNKQNDTTWRDLVKHHFEDLLVVYNIKDQQHLQIIKEQWSEDSLAFKPIGLLNMTISALLYNDQSAYKSSLVQLKSWLTANKQLVVSPDIMLKLEELIKADLYPTKNLHLQSLQTLNLLLDQKS